MVRRRHTTPSGSAGAATITSANANETSPADRDFAGPSKNRTIAGAIRGLFRAAVKAVTRRDDDEEPPKPRRRKGETESDFRRCARRIVRGSEIVQSFRRRAVITARYLTVPAEAFAVATRYLADTLDLLRQATGDDAGATFDEDFDTVSNHTTLDL